MRAAFTIVLNGLHHIQHNNFLETHAAIYDKWVFVCGATMPSGSTSWCNAVPKKYYSKTGGSIDGTEEFLEDFAATHKNVAVIRPSGLWLSKDKMVNTAMREIKKTINSGWLWQLDIDEQWRIDDVEYAEKYISGTEATSGCFKCVYYLGENLIAIGRRGEGISEGLFGWNRVWKWGGELFLTHEPPMLANRKEVYINVPVKFRHYSMMFKKDVEFKDVFYTDRTSRHLDNWIKLQKTKDMPQPLGIIMKDAGDDIIITKEDYCDLR